jgi:hypothetical protein
MLIGVPMESETVRLMQQMQRDISALSGRIDTIANTQKQLISKLNEALPQHKECITNLDSVLIRFIRKLGYELDKETLTIYEPVNLDDKCDESDPHGIFNDGGL